MGLEVVSVCPQGHLIIFLGPQGHLVICHTGSLAHCTFKSCL